MTGQPARLLHPLPFLVRWPLVNKTVFRSDFVAGLTGAIVVLPQAVAFAPIAGMPPEYVWAVRRHGTRRYCCTVRIVTPPCVGTDDSGVSRVVSLSEIVFLVAWGLIDFKEIQHILKRSRRETAIMSVTFFGTLFLDLELAIFMGVLLSPVLYLERVSKPQFLIRPPDPRLPKRAFSSDPSLTQCPQLCFLRIDGSLFFVSVDPVKGAFASLEAMAPVQKHLAIVAKGINFTDLAGDDVLVKEARKRKARGGDMDLVNVKQGLWDSLDKCECLDDIGAKNVFQTKSVAVTGVYQKLDKAICGRCEQPIFREWRMVP